MGATLPRCPERREARRETRSARRGSGGHRVGCSVPLGHEHVDPLSQASARPCVLSGTCPEQHRGDVSQRPRTPHVAWRPPYVSEETTAATSRGPLRSTCGLGHTHGSTRRWLCGDSAVTIHNADLWNELQSPSRAGPGGRGEQWPPLGGLELRLWQSGQQPAAQPGTCGRAERPRGRPSPSHGAKSASCGAPRPPAVAKPSGAVR